MSTVSGLDIANNVEREWRDRLETAVKAEREAIAQSLDKQADFAADEIDRQWAQEMAAAVRARGKKHMIGEHNMTIKQEVEQYKSQIDRQCCEMQATIDLLKATVETLHKRLKPVMADAPMRTVDHDLAPLASPLGLSINQYRQQTTAVIDELVHIVESLEI